MGKHILGAARVKINILLGSPAIAVTLCMREMSGNWASS
jgi:hypothetical protein